jgi:2-polyprenyl-3-methyl-5-hydroxy-6-metoxy-1,4-benzoquinol methylase
MKAGSDKAILEHIRCNLCNSNEYKVIYPARYDKVTQQNLVEKFRSSGDEILVDRVVKCKRCGLVYINPRLKANVIFKGYSLGEDQNFVSQAKGREITFEKSLKFIERYAKKGKILDIGTAGGSFLNVAKKRGWEVHGLEPNKWLCNWCKKNYGIEISSKSLFEQKYPSNYFDVVTLWDVLEHMPDPKKALKECNRILKPNGILVVNYPDIGSWISRFMGRKWVFLLSVHLYFFTRTTAKKMLKSAGFKPFLIKPHFQKLGLGYLLFRMEKYNRLMSKMGNKMVKILGMKNTQIPYWMGQTLVISRKNETK